MNALIIIAIIYILGVIVFMGLIAVENNFFGKDYSIRDTVMFSLLSWIGVIIDILAIFSTWFDDNSHKPFMKFRDND